MKSGYGALVSRTGRGPPSSAAATRTGGSGMTATVRRALVALAVACATAAAVAGTALAQGTASGTKTVGAADIQCGGSMQVTLTIEQRPVGRRSRGHRPRARSVREHGRTAHRRPHHRSEHVRRHHRRGDRRHARRSDRKRQPRRRRQLRSLGDARRCADDGRDGPEYGDQRAGRGRPTNHADAISLAQSTLAGSLPTNTKQMIIFTDGETTAGGDGHPRRPPLEPPARRSSRSVSAP